MVEALALRISNYLVSEGVVTEDDKEVVAYGLFHIAADTQQIIILLALSIFLHVVPEVTIFSLFFCMLKRYAGGTHFNHHWSCVAGFTLIVFSAVWGCKLFVDLWPPYLPIIFILSIISFALVWIKAPVVHHNNPKTVKRIQQMRIKARFTVLAQCVLVSLTALAAWVQLLKPYIAEQSIALLALCGAMGTLCVALSLVLPMPAPVKGGETHENVI